MGIHDGVLCRIVMTRLIDEVAAFTPTSLVDNFCMHIIGNMQILKRTRYVPPVLVLNHHCLSGS